MHDNKLHSDYNDVAIRHLNIAYDNMKYRERDRVFRNVKGTNKL